MIKYLLLLLLNAPQLVLLRPPLVHNCIHDQLEKLHTVPMPPLLPADSLKQSHRRTLVEYNPIRITLDFTQLDTAVSNATLKQYMIDIVTATRGFYQKRLKIKFPLTANLVLTDPSGYCVKPFQPPANDFDPTKGKLLLAENSISRNRQH